jgi:hypothetical protein
MMYQQCRVACVHGSSACRSGAVEAPLQKRSATPVRSTREQTLQHVVMPIMAANFAWSAPHLHEPAVLAEGASQAAA